MKFERKYILSGCIAVALVFSIGDIVQAQESAPLEGTQAEPSPPPPAIEDSSSTVDPSGTEPNQGSETPSANHDTSTESTPASAEPAPTSDQSAASARPDQSPDPSMSSSVQPSAVQSEAAVAPREPVTNLMKHMFMLSWNTAVPLGNSYDYAGLFSPLGMSFEYRYRIIPRLSVGATVAWNNFFDDVRATSSNDNMTVTGVQNRWLSTTALAATIHTYFPNRSGFFPYLGVDLGGYFKTRITENGWWTDTIDAWQFGFAPELGMLFPTGPVALNLNFKYHYLVKTDDASSEMFLGINFGVIITIR